MMIAVWASASDVPNTVCANARLGGTNEGPIYPDGTTKGQGGWDIGINYSNLQDLANQLQGLSSWQPKHMCGNWVRQCPQNGAAQIGRLAIMAHGLPGQLYVNGQNSAVVLTVGSIANHRQELDTIYRAMLPGATILLMGCIAGRGQPGTLLLQELQKVWPGCKIVAFVTVGFAHGGEMFRSGGNHCTEPGMRDTISLHATLDGAHALRTYGPLWNSLMKLPWASEESPGAKVIHNGQIIRQPEFDP